MRWVKAALNALLWGAVVALVLLALADLVGIAVRVFVWAWC